MKRSLPATVILAGLMMFIVSIQTEANAQGVDDPAQADAGQAVYETNCAGCHGSDGTGATGPGRDLTGIAMQGERADHIASVTNGKGIMPAHGDFLTDEEIEQAVSYVRLTFVAADDEGAADDAAAEDEGAADDAAADDELARTGISTGPIAVVGFTLLAGGAQLVVWSHRNRKMP